MRIVEPRSDGLSSHSLQPRREDTASRLGRLIVHHDTEAEIRGSTADRAYSERNATNKLGLKGLVLAGDEFRQCVESGSPGPARRRCGSAQQRERCRADTECQSTGKKTQSEDMAYARIANLDRSPVRDGAPTRPSRHHGRLLHLLHQAVVPLAVDNHV